MNARNKFRAMLAMLLLVIIAPSFARANTTMYVLCTPRGEINIRDRASSNGNREGYLMLGDIVTVTKTTRDNINREWCFCVDLGTEANEGWVCAGYLVSDPTNPDEYNGVINANGRVAAYNYIGGERQWLNVGTEVVVYATGGEWAITDCGYIRAEYISKTEE